MFRDLPRGEFDRCGGERRDRLFDSEAAQNAENACGPERGDPGVRHRVGSKFFRPVGLKQVHPIFRVANREFDLRDAEILAEFFQSCLRRRQQHRVDDGDVDFLFASRRGDVHDEGDGGRRIGFPQRREPRLDLVEISERCEIGPREMRRQDQLVGIGL